MTTTQNADTAEIEKFAALASRWWDTEGEFRTLHDINPLRLEYIERISGGLQSKAVLDVGCGGGILSESMALAGAAVTGIDLAEASLQVAKLHLHESEAKVDYQNIAVEELAAKQPASFDVVTCLEMLEHVPDPGSVVRACQKLVKPGGHVFFSTINRNPKAWLLAIVGAEYVMRMLPKGTHDYAKFITPAELESWARHDGLRAIDATGLHYNPLSREYRLGPGLDVNYLMAFEK